MKLLTYRRFVEREQAEAFVQILAANNIGFEMEEYSAALDSVYVGQNTFDAKFHVKIKGEDFGRADAVMLRESDQAIAEIGSDHYLYQFTDQELYDVISKPDEWSELDYRLAAKILKERGKEVGQQKIEELKAERIKELAKPDESHGIWIVIGYISALMGGLIGIFIGWHLSVHKKTLPDGRRIKAYSKGARQHGTTILIIGLIMLTVLLIFYFSGT